MGVPASLPGALHNATLASDDEQLAFLEPTFLTQNPRGAKSSGEQWGPPETGKKYLRAARGVLYALLAHWYHLDFFPVL